MSILRAAQFVSEPSRISPAAMGATDIVRLNSRRLEFLPPASAKFGYYLDPSLRSHLGNVG